MWCDACRSTGAIHCAMPDECGNMLSATAAADNWKAWLDDLPLPFTFDPAIGRLQDFITGLTARIEAQAGARADAQAAVALVVEQAVMDLPKAVGAAATKWCGEKDRETFQSDIEYFRTNWRALPGLRDYVLRALAPADALAEVQRLRDERDNLRAERDDAMALFHASEKHLHARLDAAEAERDAALARAEKAEQARDRIDQWRETAIVERDTYSEERDAAEGRVAALTEALGDMVGLFSADNVLRKGTHMNATLKLARAALAQTPTDPGDGWTWNERLGWIGPDGKPADPRRRG